ncbi:MAG: hypothetical protein M1358_06725, partial [Chloroflexi bacterium]|nr:hypothetical protein [Chloroflexota bacterium]
MVDTLKTTLIARAKHAGAYEAKVADPRVGFEHGIPGRRPLDLWDRCRSVIVCAVPNPAWANNTYVGTIRSEQDSVPLGQMPGFVFSPRYALRRLNNYLRLYVLHEVQNALRSDGYEAKTDERTQEKLCAY